MKALTIFVALAVATTLAACGGGDSDGEATDTGSSQQSRTELSPEASIDFVKAAISEGASIDLIDRLLAPLAPAQSASAVLAPKDIGLATCRRVTEDPNCKGQLRYEADFLTKEPQEVLRAGTKLIVDFENIEGADLTLSGPINTRFTFSLEQDLSLISRYSGLFTLAENRTTPSQLAISIRYKLEQLTIQPNINATSYVVNGRYIKNPDLRFGLDISEDITFSNWAITRSQRSAGAQAKMRSSRYLVAGSPSINAKNTVTTTVISSTPSRTEYRVEAKADHNDLSTVRTVIKTFNSNGDDVYSAT